MTRALFTTAPLVCCATPSRTACAYSRSRCTVTCGTGELDTALSGRVGALYMGWDASFRSSDGLLLAHLYCGSTRLFVCVSLVSRSPRPWLVVSGTISSVASSTRLSFFFRRSAFWRYNDIHWAAFCFLNAWLLLLRWLRSFAHPWEVFCLLSSSSALSTPAHLGSLCPISFSRYSSLTPSGAVHETPICFPGLPTLKGQHMMSLFPAHDEFPHIILFDTSISHVIY
jgi:hypothetical protein